MRPGLAIGIAMVGLLALAAAAAALWPPAIDIDIPSRLLPASAAHWLGTDSLGRDVAAQLFAGARNAFVVGVLAVGLGALAGMAVGLLAAASPGWFDSLLMRIVDFGFAFPALLTAIMLTALNGPGLAVSVTAIGLFNLPVFARITRGAARSVWAREFVLAARVAGRTRWQISLAHVLPNIGGALIVQATLQFAGAILAEAALSYLGLGTQPPQPSWGRMLNEAQSMLFQAPWLAVWPGLAIALSVLGLNLLGDGLRDRLDPRLA
jgi:peptide/nickel transport system permease protein